MTTIPDDMVERVARAIADQMHAGGDFGMTGADAYRRRSAEFMSMARAAIEAMQPAILAERERCAKVAEDLEIVTVEPERTYTERDDFGDAYAVTIPERRSRRILGGKVIAAAIRSQS